MAMFVLLLVAATVIFVYVLGKRSGNLASQQSQVGSRACMRVSVTSGLGVIAKPVWITPFHVQAVADRERTLRKEERAGRTRAEVSFFV